MAKSLNVPKGNQNPYIEEEEKTIHYALSIMYFDFSDNMH